jgi:SSS family solute:Na+ symporter
VRVGRIATIVVVILGILWIPVMRGIGKVLYAYLQDVQSILAPGIAAAFLLGILSKRITPAAGLTGLLTGFSIGMLRLIFMIFKNYLDPDGTLYHVFVGTNWLHYEIINFAISIVTMIVVSYFTPKIDEKKIVGLYLGSATAEQKAITRASWTTWDVVASAVIIAVIIAFYAYFWN